MPEAMLNTYGEPVVGRLASGIHPRYGTEIRDWTACLHSQRLANQIRARLIVIGDDRQPQAVVSVVGNFQDRVLKKLALKGNDPGLNVRPFRIARDVRVVRGKRIEI